MKDLIFNVKEIYFRQIQAKTKTEEFRLVKPYWTDRLEKYQHLYTGIQIRLGYPKSGDDSRIEKFAWCGYTIKKVDLMGEGIKTVYAFPLRAKIIGGKLKTKQVETLGSDSSHFKESFKHVRESLSFQREKMLKDNGFTR